MWVAGGDRRRGAAYGRNAAIPYAPVAPYRVELAGTFDTGTDPRCMVVAQPVGVELCALVAYEFFVGDLTTTGARPLVLAAEDISVFGSLQIGPRLTVGTDADCAGRGEITHVVQGCGGTGLVGGAVYLVARHGISVFWSVFAPGAGAHAGGLADKFNGRGSTGEGGGGGGLIALEAPTVEIAAAATVAANGGGGAHGNPVEGNFDLDPVEAQDGSTTDFDAPARGGTTNKGGNGGNGGTLHHPATAGGPRGNGVGVGGPGGPTGAVWIKGAYTGGDQVSPAPTVVP